MQWQSENRFDTKADVWVNYRLDGENMAGLIGLAIFFLILAFIAYILGAQGIAGFSMEIAKWLIIIFVILAIISALFLGEFIHTI